jgi:hypothetical protein
MVGNLTNFSFNERGNLVVTLTPEGREEIADIREAHPEWSDNDIFIELTEHYWTNGWTIVSPADIGALINDDCIILSEDVDYDDHGNLLGIGLLYWYPDYQLFSEVEVMLRDGFVVMQKENEE